MMGRFLLMSLIPLIAGCGHTAARDLRAERVAELERIAMTCGLPAATLRLVGTDELQFRPSPEMPYERVDCALKALKKSDIPMKMGFVGNEAYDPGNQR